MSERPPRTLDDVLHDPREFSEILDDLSVEEIIAISAEARERARRASEKNEETQETE